MIPLQKFHPRPERNTLSHPVFRIRIFPVNHILLTALPDMSRKHLIPDTPLPGIPFLSPHILPAAVPIMISTPAILPIMIMITDQMRINPIPLQNLRHRIIIRLHRPPAPMQEIITPRMNLPPRRHTRQTPHITLIKSNTPLRQPLKIRRLSPLTPIRRKHMPIQRIIHNHYSLHKKNPSFS